MPLTGLDVFRQLRGLRGDEKHHVKQEAQRLNAALARPTLILLSGLGLAGLGAGLNGLLWAVVAVANLLYALPLWLRSLVNLTVLLLWCASHATGDMGLAGLASPQSLGALVLLGLAHWLGSIQERSRLDAALRAYQQSLKLDQIQYELGVAAHLQQAILPHDWPATAGCAMWGQMRPAANVGGDFYDHYQLDANKYGVVLADVSGKGVAASLFAVLAKTVVRSRALHAHASSERVVAMANEELSRDNHDCMFVTGLYAQYDALSGDLEVVNAGHPAPLLVRSDGSVQWLATPRGRALGLVADTHYSAYRMRLQAGEMLLMFTDGVLEALNTADQEFGRERLEAVFQGASARSPAEAVARVFQAVDNYSGGREQSDDIACVALIRPV
jgi:serine phosphatase RsbU (regulator of sigma subunit)